MPPIQPHRSTQSAWKQCACARHARLNRVKCTIARPKEVPLGEGGSHKARQNGPKHYPGDPTGAANRGPAKAQRKWVWWGEEESPKGISSGHSGTTELLPRKAKRRMWSLRRRGAPFSTIFLHEKKDGAPGGPTEKRMPVKPKASPPLLFSIPYSIFFILSSPH